MAPLPRHLVLLLPLLGSTLPGCTRERVPDELRERAASFDGNALAPRSRGAWRRLLEAEFFGSVTNVWTWSPRGPASDALTLWHANEVDALLHVALEGSAGGRLWAMRALLHVAPRDFGALARTLRRDREPVEIVEGCFGRTEAVAAAFTEDLFGDEELPREYRSAFVELEERDELERWAREARNGGEWLREGFPQAATVVGGPDSEPGRWPRRPSRPSFRCRRRRGRR